MEVDHELNMVEMKYGVDTLSPECLLISPSYDLDFAPLENGGANWI